MNLSNLNIKKAHQLLQLKEISARDLVADALLRIEKSDSKIKAFLTVCSKMAFVQAEEVDEKIARGEEIGILSGIPYSVKDVFSTKGIKTTASSRILANYVPVYNATVIEKLNQQGAILIGKTNCDAFGFGSSTENSDYQVTSNPWDLSKVSGGSSGGSAAAVVSNMGLFSIAEDTGGSIRQPASFCGATGIKVTYGRVSRYGVLAYGSSLDTVGVIAKNVEDTAAVLELIAGKDPLDATTLYAPVDSYSKALKENPGRIKLGLPKEYFNSNIEKEVKEAIENAISDFKKIGFQIIEVSLPFTKYAVPAYYLSGISEVSANLARYDGIRFGFFDKTAQKIEEVYDQSRSKGFGDEAKRRIMLGTYALSAGYYEAYYKKAQKVRTLLKKDFEKVFEKVDLLIAPVSPFPAFNIGEKAKDPLKMWLADIFTVTINPAGIPSLALPCGFSSRNLPLGFQLIGPQLSEKLLFQAGFMYQSRTNWHKILPQN